MSQVPASVEELKAKFEPTIKEISLRRVHLARTVLGYTCLQIQRRDLVKKDMSADEKSKAWAAMAVEMATVELAGVRLVDFLYPDMISLLQDEHKALEWLPGLMISILDEEEKEAGERGQSCQCPEHTKSDSRPSSTDPSAGTSRSQDAGQSPGSQ